MKKLLLPCFLLLLISISYSCNREAPPDEPESHNPPMFNLSVVDLYKVIEVKAYGDIIEPRIKRSAIRYLVNDALAQVKSVSVGIVDSVVFNSDPNYTDYRVRIRPFKNSLWYVVYNHVAQVKVKVGDPVAAGAVLGSVGTGDLVDLQVNKIVYESSGIKYESTVCPSSLFHSSVMTAHDQMATRLGKTVQTCSSGSALPYYSEPWRE